MIVTATEMLMETHQPCPAQGGEPLFDTERHETRLARPGELILIPRGYGLTLTEVMKVLSGELFPPGPLSPRRDRVARPAVTGEILNAIGEDFRRRSKYPARREEIIRSLHWARQQRTSGRVRWAGKRVRVRETATRTRNPGDEGHRGA